MSFSLVELDKNIGINLIPFHYEKETSFHIIEVILNIVIFIPLGIYFKLLNYNLKQTITFGFSYSLTLELSQFILKIGISDITDIITNTTGVIVGYSIYMLLSKITNNIKKLNIILKIFSTIVTILFTSLIFFLLIINY